MRRAAVVDIVATRHLSKPEMEIQAAQALQRLQSDAWPKAGEQLTVLAAQDDDVRDADYESRWLR